MNRELPPLRRSGGAVCASKSPLCVQSMWLFCLRSAAFLPAPIRSAHRLSNSSSNVSTLCDTQVPADPGHGARWNANKLSK